MKTSKKIISMVLCIVMVASTFCGLGFVLGDFKAEAAITLGGITQQRVVSNYESIYAGYQDRFFLGDETNEPTNFVIPGLASSDDYTPQGMTYWAEKEWILISAYDASGSKKNSVIYALDAVTTDFVALFKIVNADGTVNTSHGGGIAASEYNFYYADSDSKISYFPLSEMDVAEGTVKEIKLVDSIDCSGELNTAKTSYCCYEDGVLWAGNFYYNSSDYDYGQSAHSTSDSMIVGYRLEGNSSAEEWYYLSTNFNLVTLNSNYSSDYTVTKDANNTMTFKTMNVDGANAEIRGTITSNATESAPVGEITSASDIGTFNLTEGKTYKIEFISDNNRSDIYMWSPGGKHCNVKQSQQSTITNLGNGKYHYQMIFTAGVKPTGADSGWQAAGVDDGTSYTGTYSFRFDQDNITGSRSFNMTDISVTEYVEPNGFTPDSKYEGVGCAGNPTYVITIPGIDKIQYAMVSKGKIYISRSWKRTSGTNHTRELMISDIDIYSPGTSNLEINGRTRPCHVITYSAATHYGGDNGSDYDLNQMLYMGESLCVIDDYLYMFGEGAAWNYNGKDSSNVCPEPIDVLWKIDQHALLGEERTYDDTAPAYYEKVQNLSDIKMTDDYIIVHESSVVDPVTQNKVLYAIDAFGGYGDDKLPKQDAGTQANSGDSMGIVGYEISDYSIETLENGNQVIHVPEEVDTQKSLHWQITGAGTSSLRINNKDLYYAKNNHLYFGSRLFAMTTDSRTNLDLITLEQYNGQAGDFRISYVGANGTYYLWCNDGSDQSLIDTYTAYYGNHGKSGYVPQYHGLEEIAGTFHCDGDAAQTGSNTGNLTGASVGAEMQIIHIYKRVADPYSSSYDSRIYSDLSAELKSDGTYDITLETYATSELQYQTVDERPTDFIFVLDASGSMTNNNDARGYHTELNNWSALTMKQAAGDNDDIAENSNYNIEWTSNFYYKLPDSKYARISVAVNKGPDGTYSRDIWLWCKHPDTGRCYKISQNGYLLENACTGDPSTDSASRLTEAEYLANPSGYGYASASEILSEASSDTNRTDYHNSRNSKDKRRAYEVLKYTYTDGYGDTRATYYSYGDCSRLLAMQNAVEQLTYKIADEAARTGLNHRIAITQFGSDSGESYLNNGMYTNSSVSMVQYSGANSISASTYANAFYEPANFASVRRIIGNIVTWNGDPDTYSNYGFEMANNIITNSDASYLGDGNRSACIIMITDGIPGIGNDSGVANTVANNAIAEAYKSKHQGAYVYSVQMGNNSLSGFDMDKYMDYTSSEYIYAESMDVSGDRNTKDIAYRIDVPTGSTFSLDGLVNSIFESVTSNSTNAMAQLDADSILREHLTDAFILDNATVTYQTALADYDGLGRLYFKDPSTATGFTTNIDKTNNIITVKGFDYSTKFVGKSNLGTGEKLIVTISGVIANADAELLNTSINETETTALYQDDTFMNKDIAVKQFPTEFFTIPEYTYIMDYDIPMYDNDVNGTLCSVDSTLQKQSTYKTVLDTENMGIEFANGNQDMIYTLNSRGGLTEKMSKGYVLIQRDDGTYDWFRLNILPASNVYYEESSLETISNSKYISWSQKGSTSSYQQLSDKSDVYGNDPAYSQSTEEFSLGTYLEATVSSSNKRSETKTFTFTGTGFDLISACGTNTGIQTVTVRKDGKIVKSYIVDTYYNDANYNTVHQVPIVHFKGDYGTYTVETTASYYSFAGGLKHSTVNTAAIDGTEIEASYAEADYVTAADLFAQIGMDELAGSDVEFIWMDDNSVLNGGTGVEGSNLSTQADGTTVTSLVNYVDGFRIYNPLDDDSVYISNERNATYYNVIDAITSGDMGGNSLAAYVEGGSGDTEITFGNYLESGGPKFEVFLEQGDAVAFRFKATDFIDNNPKAMVSIRAASGTPKVKFGVTNATATWTFDVKSASETYYDITNNLGTDSEGYFTLTVQNDGGGILAVDNVKVVNATLVPTTAANLAEISELMTMAATEVDASTFSVASTSAEKDYSDYIPAAPGSGADLSIDPEGEIPDYIPDSTPDETPDDSGAEEPEECLLKTFFNKIVAFFKKIFGYVKNLIPIF